jgi:pyruvate kinase
VPCCAHPFHAVLCHVQVHASLIVVLTRGGSTGRLVAKYRPLVPVLTVAVPVLTTDSLTWTCSNEAPARQVRQSRAVIV